MQSGDADAPYFGSPCINHIVASEEGDLGLGFGAMCF